MLTERQQQVRDAILSDCALPIKGEDLRNRLKERGFNDLEVRNELIFTIDHGIKWNPNRTFQTTAPYPHQLELPETK